MLRLERPRSSSVVFNTNLFGAMACIRAVLPHMRQQGSGTIVNISSINGRVPAAGGAAYTASKFALEGLSETLRLELEPFGIRVVIVQPGQFATEIWGQTGFLDQDVEPVYAEICEDWRSLGGAPRRKPRTQPKLLHLLATFWCIRIRPCGTRSDRLPV